MQQTGILLNGWRNSGGNLTVAEEIPVESGQNRGETGMDPVYSFLQCIAADGLTQNGTKAE